MATTKEAAGSKYCSRKLGRGRCNSVSADNELHYCEKHYKDYKDLELEMKKLPPDELRCGRRNGIAEGEIGSWRCKNFRLSNSSYCEKHYIYQGNQLKKKQRKNESGGIQPDTSDTILQSGSADIGTKMDNVETTQGSPELDFTDFLTENPSLITSNKLKEMEMEKKKLPPDEVLCSQTNGKRWRCQNFRMGHGAPADDNTVPKTKLCEKHYYIRAKYQENLKKRSRDGEETMGSKRRRKRKVTEEEDDGSLGHTCGSDIIVSGESAKLGTKRKNVEITSGEQKSSIAISEPVLENLTTTYEDCSILRCQELHNSEITQTGENVEEWADWDFLEETPSQHGSSSQAHALEMSNKTLGNLVSHGGDSLGKPEDSNSFVDSKVSLGDHTPLAKIDILS